MVMRVHFPFSGESMRSLVVSLLLTLAFCTRALPQQSSSIPASDSAKAKKDKAEAAVAAKRPEPAAQPQPAPPAPEAKAEPAKESPGDKEEHYDMTEVPPVVTHRQITVDGMMLKYSATAGRLPIKRGDGKIEAEMFFVAYTLDGQEAGKRPLTFSFNGGPGSASVWLHMGALGPKRVVLQPNGFMPAAPYRMIDNPQ